jgi:hypothetical protein
MPGAKRTRSLACKWKKHASKSPQVRRITRHSRTRMVLTVSFALFPETGFVVPVAGAMRSISPTWRQHRDARTTRLRRPQSAHSSLRDHVHRIPHQRS